MKAIDRKFLFYKAKQVLDKIIQLMNYHFNTLSLTVKKILLLIFGSVMGGVSIMLIIQALSIQEINRAINIQKINPPTDIYMADKENKLHSSHLIPRGKYKGEINGEFEAFYLAVDIQGKTYINREPDFSKDTYSKTNGWEEISKRELNEYRKHLHFIPSKGKGLRP